MSILLLRFDLNPLSYTNGQWLKTKIGSVAKLPILSSNYVSTVVLLFVFRKYFAEICLQMQLFNILTLHL